MFSTGCAHYSQLIIFEITYILLIFYKFQASFTINLEDDDVSAGDIRAEVIGPDSHHNVHFNWVGRRGEGYFTPTETGLHKVGLLSSL